MSKLSDINICTLKYTFGHPNGPLIMAEKAAFEDMNLKRFVQKDCAFAGHSLGECSVLASIADVLPISSLFNIVSY